jgi:hypothetical protein
MTAALASERKHRDPLSYLAWQDEPGSPLGQFITKQAPQPNKEIAVSFTGWLQELFLSDK